MPVLGMNLLDVMIVRQFLDEIDAISRKYESNREEIIAVADGLENLQLGDCLK
jgi:propanediol dehydratase small subunit